MYSDKTQKVHVALTEQTNVIKTGDNRYFTFIGDENTYSISELVFRNTSISLEGLLDELKGGRCIGQKYNTDPYQRVPGSKPKFDWRGSSWIGVDIDDSNVAPLTMHNELRWTPTFTMTTQSHWKGEHTNRYRIFYFFNTVMQNYDGFRKVAERIASDVRRVLTNHGENYKKVFDDSLLVAFEGIKSEISFQLFSQVDVIAHILCSSLVFLSVPVFVSDVIVALLFTYYILINSMLCCTYVRLLHLLLGIVERYLVSFLLLCRHLIHSLHHYRLRDRSQSACTQLVFHSLVYDVFEHVFVEGQLCAVYLKEFFVLFYY